MRNPNRLGHPAVEEVFKMRNPNPNRLGNPVNEEVFLNSLTAQSEAINRWSTTQHPLGKDKFSRAVLDDQEEVVDGMLASKKHLVGPKARMNFFRKNGINGDTVLEHVNKLVQESLGPQKDMSNFFTRRRGQCVHAEYILFLSGAVDPAFADKRRKEAWHIDIVSIYAVPFLTWKIRNTRGTQGRTHMTTQSAQLFLCAFVGCISRLCVDNNRCRIGDEMLARSDLYERLHNQKIKLCEELKLVRYAVNTRHYFGKREVQLMLVGIFQAATGSAVEVAVQKAILILLPFYLAVRPGSLGPSCSEFKDRGLYPRVSDFTIQKKGRCHFEIIFIVANFKGYNGSNGRRVQFMLSPVRLSQNVLLDITQYIVLHFFYRGAFKQDFKSIQELLDYDDGSYLDFKDSIKDEPAFLKIVEGGRSFVQPPTPIMAWGITAIVQEAAKNVGLPPGTAMSLRRDTCDDWCVKMGIHLAQIYMHHKEGRSTVTDNYANVTGNAPVVGVRLGEINCLDTEFKRAQHEQRQLLTTLAVSAVFFRDAVSESKANDGPVNVYQTENGSGKKRAFAVKVTKEEEAAIDNLPIVKEAFGLEFSAFKTVVQCFTWNDGKKPRMTKKYVKHTLPKLFQSRINTIPDEEYEELVDTYFKANENHTYVKKDQLRRFKERKIRNLANAALQLEDDTDESSFIAKHVAKSSANGGADKLLAKIENPLDLFDYTAKHSEDDKELDERLKDQKLEGKSQLLAFIQQSDATNDAAAACKLYIEALPPLSTEFESSLPAMTRQEAIADRERNELGELLPRGPKQTPQRRESEDLDVPDDFRGFERGLENDKEVDVLGLSAEEVRETVFYKLANKWGLAKAEEAMLIQDEDGKYSCQLCLKYIHKTKYRSNNKQNVKRHMETEHTKWRELEDKMRTSQKNVFFCPEEKCRKQFTEFSKVRKHCRTSCMSSEKFIMMDEEDKAIHKAYNSRPKDTTRRRPKVVELSGSIDKDDDLSDEEEALTDPKKFPELRRVLEGELLLKRKEGDQWYRDLDEVERSSDVSAKTVEAFWAAHPKTYNVFNVRKFVDEDDVWTKDDFLAELDRFGLVTSPSFDLAVGRVWERLKGLALNSDANRILDGTEEMMDLPTRSK